MKFRSKTQIHLLVNGVGKIVERLQCKRHEIVTVQMENAKRPIITSTRSKICSSTQCRRVNVLEWLPNRFKELVAPFNSQRALSKRLHRLFVPTMAFSYPTKCKLASVELAIIFGDSNHMKSYPILLQWPRSETSQSKSTSTASVF